MLRPGLANACTSSWASPRHRPISGNPIVLGGDCGVLPTEIYFAQSSAPIGLAAGLLLRLRYARFRPAPSSAPARRTPISGKDDSRPAGQPAAPTARRAAQVDRPPLGGPHAAALWLRDRGSGECGGTATPRPSSHYTKGTFAIEAHSRQRSGLAHGTPLDAVRNAAAPLTAALQPVLALLLLEELIPFVFSSFFVLFDCQALLISVALCLHFHAMSDLEHPLPLPLPLIASSGTCRSACAPAWRP